MYVSEWKGQISPPRRAHTNQPIITKLGPTCYVHHTTNLTENGLDEMRGAIRAGGVETPYFNKVSHIFFSFNPYNYQ